MQDTSYNHSFYDISSKFPFIFTIFIVSHLVVDTRLSTAYMVVHVFLITCKLSTTSRSNHSAAITVYYILFSQGKCRRRRALRRPNDDRQPHHPRYFLLQMRHYSWSEIRKCPFQFTPLLSSQNI